MNKKVIIISIIIIIILAIILFIKSIKKEENQINNSNSIEKSNPSEKLYNDIYMDSPEKDELLKIDPNYNP